MFKKLPGYSSPLPNTIVWRYMDLDKFKSLINKESLYFRRLDALEDEFEGSLPQLNRGARFSSEYDYKGNLLRNFKEHGVNVSEEMFDEISNPLGSVRNNLPPPIENMRYINYVSCWHINKYESFLMWNKYIQDAKDNAFTSSKLHINKLRLLRKLLRIKPKEINKGIAIKSTFRNLKKCLIKTDIVIYIGKIKYIDYNCDKLQEVNTIPYSMTKQIEFQDEREFRLLARFIPSNNFISIPSKEISKGVCREDDKGLFIKVDLKELITEVIIGPKLFEDLSPLCNSLLKGKGLNISVKPSVLDGCPVF